MARWLTALLAAALLAVAASGCGSSSDDGSDKIATVGGVEVTRQDLDDEIAMLSRAQRAGADPTDEEDERLEAQALVTLLLREAVEQDAADRDVKVSQAEARERWDAARTAQFETPEDQRRFLGERTEQDMLEQFRLQLLTEHIQQQVSENAGGGKQGEAAMAKYQKNFEKRWQGQTECQKGLQASLCR